jgi:hypothetical protein
MNHVQEVIRDKQLDIKNFEDLQESGLNGR